MTVRAKFRCTANLTTGDTARVSFSPVIDGSDENKSFYKYTPGGNIDLQVVNPDAANQFAIGKEYYVDFTPA